MEAVAQSALRKLRKQTSRSHREVRESIDGALASLSASEKEENVAEKMTEPPFEPFLLACLTRHAKVTAASLDGIERFLSFGYLRGTSTVSPDFRQKLKQKLGNVSSRAEASNLVDSLLEGSLVDCIVAVVSSCDDHPDETVQVQTVRVLLTAVTSSSCEVHGQALLRAVRACFHLHLVSKSVTAARASLLQMLSVVFSRMESFDEKVRVETASTLEEYNSQRSNGTNGKQLSWYPQIVQSLQIQLEKKEKVRDVENETRSRSSSFTSVLHKDAYLVFRSLCRISLRSVAEDTATSTATSIPEDPFAFQSKLLSLELVRHIIDQAGPSFASSGRLLKVVQQSLCQSLLQNCTSNYPEVVELSLQVFLSLMKKLKRELKRELEVFINAIFLRLLQSAHASRTHKALVLEALRSICDDPVVLSEIFLNYDCDWHTNDLFRQIVDALARVAKEPTDGNLASRALECLAAAVASLKKAANFVDVEQEEEEEEDSEAEEVLPSPPVHGETMSAVEAFDKKQRRQEELLTGILKFNVKPSAGITYLQQRGYLGKGTPKDVARFLLQYAHRLDKTMVGDYLGREAQYQDGFCVQVLHEYVDLFDFHNMEIDDAMRVFLAGFRLPGESQKIDRMMEKFAQRYQRQCPSDNFPTADTAFILSFSIILLQTDLHNPSIAEEKKMDKNGFVRNNRGIKDGEDLPEEFLHGIFDRVKETPYSLQEDDEMRTQSNKSRGAGLFASQAAADRMRRDAFLRERESMVRLSEALFKQKSSSQMVGKDDSDFRQAPRAEKTYVRPMFQTLWAPLLAACSVAFEELDQDVAIQLCLDCFRGAVHLASRLRMPSERDAFVSVLAKFTGLQHARTRRLRRKHVDAARALIAISLKEGNYLGDAWRDILACLSELARLQSHAQSLAPEALAMAKEKAQGTPTSSWYTSTSTRRSTSTVGLSPVSKEAMSSSTSNASDDGLGTSQLDENAALVQQDLDNAATDRVFSSSVQLRDGSLQDFVIQLCVVSLGECASLSSDKDVSPSAVFSLQKLVEVADMNMHVRSRIVWTSTWQTLSRHFTAIGCHDVHWVALYAVDSLRQLSIKFLEREELHNFNFQRLFLAPFDTIMANADSTDVKELVLRCVDNLVRARHGQIRSGWKTLWRVLRQAADDDSDELKLLYLGFEISARAVKELTGDMQDVFSDAVDTLVAFATAGETSGGKRLTQMSLQVVDILSSVCVPYLSKAYFATSESSPRDTKSRKLSMIETSPKLPDRRSSTPTFTTKEQLFTDCALHTGLWWPIFSGLATLAASQRVTVRASATSALFTALEHHGHVLAPSLWRLVFHGVLLPLLDELRHVEDRANAATTCVSGIYHLYGIYYERVGLVPDVLFVLRRCLSDASLASSAANALEGTLKEYGHKLSENAWGLVADELRAVLAYLLPSKTCQVVAMYPSVVECLGMLLAQDGKARRDQSMLHVVLALQDVVGTVLVRRARGQVKLSTGHAASLLQALQQSCDGTLEQEMNGKKNYCQVLFQPLVRTCGEEGESEMAREEVKSVAWKCLREYVAWTKGDPLSVEDGEELRREWPKDAATRAEAYEGLVVGILQQVAKLPSEEMKAHWGWVYPLLTAMIALPSTEVRLALTAVLRGSIATLLPFD